MYFCKTKQTNINLKFKTMQTYLLPHGVKVFDTPLTFQDIKKGMNYNLRHSIMLPIIKKNVEELNIEIKGIKLKLKANYSISGKSLFYFSNLTQAQYIYLRGSDFGLSQKGAPSISVDDAGTVTIYGGGNYFHRFDSNKKVTIL